MRLSLADLAAALGAEVTGDAALVVEGLAEPARAGPSDLALAMSPAYAEALPRGRARAAVLWPGADPAQFGLEAALAVPRPRFAMAALTRAFDPGPEIAPGVHPSAVIDPTAEIGPGAAIGPLVVICPRARVGARARIAAHASIGAGAVLGEEALLLEGVRIAAGARIGARFIAQPNAVVGGDGFSFVTEEASTMESARASLGRAVEVRAQSWHRIHSLGGVEIGDDVELGALSAIDRGTVRPTEVGAGTKIDNLVQVGHNVRIGPDCLLCAGAAVAGSSRLGARVVLGGQSGVADNIVLGDDVVIGGGSKVLSNVPAGRAMLGYPAMRMDTHVEVYKALRRLPRLMARLASGKNTGSQAGSE
jgi:UDP-3-O-[3-hydroxymyristoyl] glucosamine N-acyltransferase